MWKEKTAESKKSNGIVTQIVLSAMSIVLGALLLFAPQMQVEALCYLFCGVLIVAGGVAIISFFLSERYKRVESKDFTLGVLLILLGCCGLSRISDLAAGFTVCMGILSLCLSVLILQGTVQLHVLGNRFWVVNLVLTILSLGCSILVLADVQIITEKINHFTYWVMLIVGISCLISLLLTALVLKNSKDELQTEE